MLICLYNYTLYQEIKVRDDMEFVESDRHKMHLFRVGDEKNSKLVFMSGSGTISPVSPVYIDIFGAVI